MRRKKLKQSQFARATDTPVLHPTLLLLLTHHLRLYCRHPYYTTGSNGLVTVVRCMRPHRLQIPEVAHPTLPAFAIRPAAAQGCPDIEDYDSVHRYRKTISFDNDS
ncbi:hypothetical protein [Tatumella sp. UCD-D_suzukii]|uniref:hypothetical protein n=1 Tax=Tatumella sp. UCD-D_suzukii TaxID=1408192 RepID=UPI00128ED69B|nr:hypothetical protein [Tatumella sp. UCD-D_suzukii]